jgi:RimJ/RimL family protein N-acetyltransferase
VATLVEWAIASTTFDRLVLQTWPGNERSQNVARRTGFALERVDAGSGHTHFVLNRKPGPPG